MDQRHTPLPNPPTSSGTAVPATIGRYRLLEKLAKGGMAEVFAARSYGAHGFEKTVALKRILPKFGQDPQFVRMMVDEAKISVLLNHPNIAQIFELGEQEGDYFIVMEFVPGQSLSAVVKRLKEIPWQKSERLPVLEACFIVVELLQGLHAAHVQPDADGAAAHIIHRDVSPQNTLLSFDGHVKVIDFGIARARDRLEATEVGTIKGKLRYLAPEMIDPGRFTKSGDFDHRVDVFAAGVVLWELMAGRPLFPGDDELKVYDDITDGETPDLQKEGRCDAALMAIIAKALERRLDRRYATAEAFADDLRAYVYRSDPSFTHKRVATILDTLFPEEKARHLSLERGGHSGASRASPASGSSKDSGRNRIQGPGSGKAPAQAEGKGISLPTTTPDDSVEHTRSDRHLANRSKGARSAGVVPLEDAPTALVDQDKVDPLGELRQLRDVTVVTLVSRIQIAADAGPGENASGVFSAAAADHQNFSSADDDTLTVGADSVRALKDGLGIGSKASVDNPAIRAIGSDSGTAPEDARPAMRPLGDMVENRVAQAPARLIDETTPETRAAPDFRERDNKRKVVAISAVVGVVLALVIVGGLDRVLNAPPALDPPPVTIVEAPSTTDDPANEDPEITPPTTTSPATTVIVLIQSNQPGAVVTVGDTEGEAPLRIPLPGGSTATATVRAPGARERVIDINVPADMEGEVPFVVDAPLSLSPVPVLQKTKPENAEVTIDGEILSPETTVEPGVPLKIHVSAAGYASVDTSLTAATATPLLVDVVLKKDRTAPRVRTTPTTTTTPPPPPPPKGNGKLTLKTTPFWGKVTIDGKALEDTTPVTVTLPAGRHDVVVSHPPKGITKRFKVVVPVDDTVTRVITFE